MSQLALSDSFEYLCYASTSITNMFTLISIPFVLDALREVTRGCRTTTDMTEGCEKSGVFYDICVELCDTTLCNAEPGNQANVELCDTTLCNAEAGNQSTLELCDTTLCNAEPGNQSNVELCDTTLCNAEPGNQ